MQCASPTYRFVGVISRRQLGQRSRAGDACNIFRLNSLPPLAPLGALAATLPPTPRAPRCTPRIHSVGASGMSQCGSDTTARILGKCDGVRSTHLLHQLAASVILLSLVCPFAPIIPADGERSTD